MNAAGKHLPDKEMATLERIIGLVASARGFYAQRLSTQRNRQFARIATPEQLSKVIKRCAPSGLYSEKYRLQISIAMSPNISLLICTYQAPPSLDLLFDSLRLQKWQPGDELIVIDNGIQMERISCVKRRLDHFTTAGVRAVYSREPKTGLTAARLNGFSLIKTEWLVLLDDDNILDEHSLAQIRNRISLNPRLGGICPRIEPIWEKSPPRWVIMLGHEVLSYNTSCVRSISNSLIEWEGGVRGLRPPGGGMIIHRCAADAFLELSRSFPLVEHLGHRGAALGSGEDYILYLQIYRAGRPTAYDGSIIIRHMIPQNRTRFVYLCRLLFRANYGFALIALALLGKALFLPSICHGVIRLTRRLATGGRAAISLNVLIAFTFALAGYVYGTFSGLLRSDLPIIKKHGLR
jgi:glycosyltransferase involved in cell wall biosynthesis